MASSLKRSKSILYILFNIILVAGMLFPAGSNVTAQDITTPETTPTITITGILSAFSSTPGVASAEQTFTVAGSNLIADITVTTPADFEISTTSGSDFATTQTLTPTDGTVATTTIYVRFQRATAGTSTGDITNASTGSTTQNMAVSGIATAVPTIITTEMTPIETIKPAVTPTSTPPREEGIYYSIETEILSDGSEIEGIKIIGPKVPPRGFERQREQVKLLERDISSGTNTLMVPAFEWVFGCSAVSAAMIAGYYDNLDWPNIYTGPTNGGVMPVNSSYWPTWSDGVDTYPNLPLAASKNGVDGRSSRGSIDDYWIGYENAEDDPFITNGWSEHTWGDAIGDYMKTSQSNYGNIDSGTGFWTWNSDPGVLDCNTMEYYSLPDGTLGMKEFYEARGYTVTDCYNQKTDNQLAGGFSFAQYKAEIDASRPVMLNLLGHTVVGIGYNDTDNTVYIHDTWDYNNHSMTWGGSYSGMALQSVSIVNLQISAPPVPTITTTGTLSDFSSTPGVASAEQTYTVAGSNLTADITITSPTDFQVSTTSGSGFTTSLTLPQTGGTVATTTIYVRFQRAATGTSTGNISNASTGATTQNVAVSGTATATTYTLTIINTDTGSGTVTSNPAGIDCGATCSTSVPQGTVVTLTGVGSTNYYHLSSWSGSGCTGTGPCSVTMNATTTVTTNFEHSTFYDVPFDHPLHDYIETLYDQGYTAGCQLAGADLLFCPEATMLRGESAVFMLRGLSGASYVPPIIWDTFITENWYGIPWAQKWAEGMWDEGLTAGCQYPATDPSRFCPYDLFTREQGAVFGLRIMHGKNYTPPAATVPPYFTDVPDTTYWSTKWLEQAYKDGLLLRCDTNGGTPAICPSNNLSRSWAAYMIVKAKGW